MALGSGVTHDDVGDAHRLHTHAAVSCSPFSQPPHRCQETAHRPRIRSPWPVTHTDYRVLVTPLWVVEVGNQSLGIFPRETSSPSFWDRSGNLPSGSDSKDFCSLQRRIPPPHMHVCVCACTRAWVHTHTIFFIVILLYFLSA